MTDHRDNPTKKTAILEAALDLIAAHGFHGAPTSKIAREAGAGVGSIYRYFKSKDDLIQELFNHVTERLSRSILKGFNPEADLREQFILLSTNTFNYMIENPKVFAFLEQFLNSPYGISHKRETILNEDVNKMGGHPLHEVLEKAKKGRFTKDLPFHILGALSFGPIIFLVRDIHAGLIDMDSATLTRVIEACWDAIKR
jgi:AcrR family transcriptional regulator